MILIADPDSSFRAKVVKHLGRRDDVVEVAGIPDVEHWVAQRADEIAVVVFGPAVSLEEALETAEWVQVRSGGISCLLVSTGMSPEVLQAAMRAGVRDVLTDSSTPEQFRDSVEHAETVSNSLRGRGTGSGQAASSKILTVFSTKGGCGKSVVASNLAVLMARMTGEEVALVDLDLQSGDLAIMLQLLPAWTIYDAAENLDRLDADALRGYLTPHRSRVHVLAAPLEPALAETVSGHAVQEILALLRGEFRYVIVDGPAFYTDQILSALDVSDECALLASMDVPSVKNLKLMLETLRQLDFGRERIHVVLNRADSRVGLRLQEVEKSIGTQVDVAIPSSRDVPLSVNQGVPLAVDAAKSSVVAGIQQLADRVRLPGPGAEYAAQVGHAGHDGTRRKILRRG